MTDSEKTVVCKICGKENIEGKIFCSGCGNRLNAEKVDHQKNFICPNCGQVIVGIQNFCRNCGTAINWNIAPSIAADTPNMFSCVHCGHHIKPGENFCRNCGNKLNSDYLAHDSTIERVLSSPAKHWLTAKAVIIFFFSILASLIITALIAGDSREFSSIAFYFVLGGMTLYYFQSRKIDYKEQYFFNKETAQETIRALCYITLLAIGNILFLFLLLAMFREDPGKALSRSYLGDTSIWSIIFCMCILPAVFEEAAFRVGVQTDLEKILTHKRAFIVTGILFEIIHLRILLLPFVFTSIYLSYLKYKTRSVWPSMIVHFYYNFFVLVIVHIIAVNIYYT